MHYCIRKTCLSSLASLRPRRRVVVAPEEQKSNLVRAYVHDREMRARAAHSAAGLDCRCRIRIYLARRGRPRFPLFLHVSAAQRLYTALTWGRGTPRSSGKRPFREAALK